MVQGSDTTTSRSAASPGQVDYRLARHALINAYRNGRIDLAEICDAHAELKRAASEVGRAIDERCPICEDADLVIVLYVFGPRLPAFGRCVTTAAELDALAKRRGTFTGYEIEVCCACWWNHLGRTFPVGDS